MKIEFKAKPLIPYSFPHLFWPSPGKRNNSLLYLDVFWLHLFGRIS